MTIALCMIVRDNAAILPRCLQSVRDHVNTYTVVDTGSRDETIAVVRRELAGITGTVLERPWVNAGHNRTELLAKARGTADYLLLLDGDQELVVDARLPPLNAPAYMLLQTEADTSWRMPFLVRGDLEWRYIGTVHEYLDCPERKNLDEWKIIHHGDGRTRADKLLTALGLLEDAIRADPADSRAVFYLANTNRELGRWQEAIHLYRRRLTMGGWDEELFYSRYQLGCILTSHVSLDQGAVELLAAWRERPHRIEPLRALAHAAVDVADRAPFPSDTLFIHANQYTN